MQNSMQLDGCPTRTHNGPQPLESLFSAGMKAGGQHFMGLRRRPNKTAQYTPVSPVRVRLLHVHTRITSVPACVYLMCTCVLYVCTTSAHGPCVCVCVHAGAFHRARPSGPTSHSDVWRTSSSAGEMEALPATCCP